MAAQHGARFIKLVDEARGRIRECTVADVLARVQAGEQFLLFDVREDREWAAGHLPGARHLGKGIAERDIEETVPDLDTEMILYCGGGYRSALAADALRQMGYTRVISMDGGFRGWKEAGHPVVQD
ncbi:MAG: rhodanese-like domain-containing protein [Planctomycetaceae bacterium]|nr:sulfurtransferase [Planctomycetaceae bacterium]